MKSINKYILVLIAFAAFFFSIAILFGKGVGLNTNSDLSSRPGNLQLSSEDPSNETNTEYEFYRERILDIFNYTLEEYYNFSLNDKEIANNYIYALWGYENGTYTKEEAQQMVQPSTPQVKFRDQYGYYQIGLTSYWVYEHTDANLRVRFRVNSEFAERVTKISAYSDYEHWFWVSEYPNIVLSSNSYFHSLDFTRPLDIVEIDDYSGIVLDYDTGYESGLSWYGKSWTEWTGPWPTGRVGIEGPASVIFETQGSPGFINDWTKLIIEYDWYFFDLFACLGGCWVKQPIHYRCYDQMNYNFYGYDGDEILLSLDDDDPDKPLLWPFTLSHATSITDSQSYLYVTGIVQDYSLFDGIEANIPGSYGSYTTYSWLFPKVRRFHMNVGNPQSLGNHEVTITIWDNDNDRSNDKKKLDIPISFQVTDDDTTPPTISVSYEGGSKTDGNPGYWAVEICDPESGLLGYWISVDDAHYGSFSGTMGTFTTNVPVPDSLGSHTIRVEAINADRDRGVIDQESSIPVEHSVSITDDDTEEPILILIDYPQVVMDDLHSFQITVYAEDASGIYSIRAHLGSITYSPSYISADGYYQFQIDSPQEPDLYTIFIIASDGDNDRPDDRKHIQKTFQFLIEDDDKDPPVITLQEELYNWDGNLINLQFTVVAEDYSGLSETVIKIAGHTFNGAGTHGVSLASGFYTLEVWVTDADNDRPNDELIKYEFYELIFDLTPPTTIATPTGIEGLNGWFISDVTIDMTAVDDTSGVAYTKFNIDGSGWIIDFAPFSISIIKEGISTIEYYSVDNVGNVEVVKTLIVKIDREAPITTHSLQPTFPNGDNGWYVSPVEITLLPDDITSGVEETYYRINGGPDVVYESSVRFSEDGIYSLEYWSVDSVGNAEAVKTLIIKIDGEAPITTHSLQPAFPNGDNGWYVSPVEITLLPDDITSGVEETYYRINGGSDVVYEGCVLFSEDGIYTLEYWSVDSVGNVEVVKTLIVKIDGEAPITTHSLQPAFPNGDNGWYVSPVEITLLPEDITSDVEETYYRINGGPDVVYEGCVLFSEDGIYSLEYWSVDEAGIVESANFVQFKIDQTDPITTLTIGTPQFGSVPTYITIETLFELEAIELGSNIKEIKYQIDSGPWLTYTAPFTIEDFGSHTIYYYSIDMAGNDDDIKSEWVQVCKTKITYLGDVSGSYSDLVYLKAELIDVATQLPIPGKLLVFEIGEQTVSVQTDFEGIAEAMIILTQKSGLYTVSALFAGDEEYLASNSGDFGFTINKEYAYAEYTGDMVVPLSGDTITLRATVFDEDDGNWGDLTKIFVTITITDSETLLPLPSHTYSAIQVETTSVFGVGVALITIDNPFTLQGEYLVKISFASDENDYYWGLVSLPVALIIYEPEGDFVTGGGWIEDENGNKGSFGFNVKYKKNGLPKGQAIYVFRDDDYIYIIKANAWVGMAIIEEDNYTIFEAKCNVKQVDALTGEIVWEEGNYRLVIEAWDNSKDGKQDVIQVRVYDKIGLIYYESGFDPYGFLGGGNIVLHIDKKK